MCRLYAFHANEPTKVECPLIYAQNALMMQSAGDLSGTTHTHGWGIATYKEGLPVIERQAWAAHHEEHFEKAAERIYSTTVLAHVRRATVGGAGIENTHPFGHKHWAFAHNGTVPGFNLFKEKMIGEIADKYKPLVMGETDSEHVFYLLLTYILRNPGRTILENLRVMIEQVFEWSNEYAPDKPMGLNIILTDGKNIYGCRIGRSLYYTYHKGLYNCEVCGFPHVHHLPSVNYRAIDIASEPITHDTWSELPEKSLFHVDDDFSLNQMFL